MNKIFYNLSESNFFVTVGKVSLYFSSEFNKSRFIEGYQDYLINESYKLKSKYGVTIINSINLLIINYYTHIEKRGFLVSINSKIYESVNDIKVYCSYDKI